MNSRLISLMLGIFMLTALVQCEDAATISSKSESELVKPTLVAPENNTEQSSSLKFDWEGAKGTEGYQVQAAISEDFSSTLIDSVVKVTSYDVKNLPQDTTIHWQVRAQGENQNSPWSKTWQFSTKPGQNGSDPISTEPQNPKDGSSDQAVDVSLRWTTVASASAYNVQIATDQAFNSIITDKQVESSSYSASELNLEQTYYWKVKPIVNDRETEWSSAFSFTTVSENENVAAVSLVAPSDGATDQTTNVTLEWEKVTGASEYQLQVGTSESFSSPVVDKSLSQQSFDNDGLEYNQTYYWRVQATGDSNQENWSSTREFKTEQETPSSSPSAFVTTQNSDFVVNGETFRFAGTNAYYLPTYEKINSSVVNKAFDAYEEAGINVIRTWGFYDGSPQYNGDITLQPEPGVYNEKGLKHLDNVIAKAKEHGVRVVLTLLNNWPQLGGVPQYNEWDGNAGGGMSHFINDPDTQKWYKNYISMLLNRTNTVTGVKYKNEPTIFSWEIIGEARLNGGDPKELRDWYQDIAQHIKSEDSNHMVATGEEGFEANSPSGYSEGKYGNPYVLNANHGSSYKLNTAIPEIDYGTAHWYPENWGLSASNFTAQHAWLKDHAQIAENLGKPFVIGEWGDDNGYGDSDQLAMYKDYWSYAEKIKLDGSLIWQFTPTSTKCFEFGGNICWPDGRQDKELYNNYKDFIQTMNNSN